MMCQQSVELLRRSNEAALEFSNTLGLLRQPSQDFAHNGRQQACDGR